MPANSSAGFSGEDTPTKASAAPLVVGIVALVASALLEVLDYLAVSPFTYDVVNVIGYFLTPFVVFMCVAWDAASQRLGRRSPWFDVRPGYSHTLRVLAIVSLAVAVVHILELGHALGEWAVQSGLFS
ncbi:MAG: hypothetical protein K9G09_05650 [Pontimonas sp.]|nr:hypothetical protein [Pontimonas sp.]